MTLKVRIAPMETTGETEGDLGGFREVLNATLTVIVFFI